VKNPRSLTVGTVSIVCIIRAPAPDRAKDQRATSVVADAADGADGVIQLVLAYGRYPDVRVPNRPSRSKTISFPSARRKVCARRSRPASARGLFGQPDRLAPTCKRSDALPVHCVLSAMISRTWAGRGSASMIFSIAACRLLA
jgi:hypothetical protein